MSGPNFSATEETLAPVSPVTLPEAAIPLAVVTSNVNGDSGDVDKVFVADLEGTVNCFGVVVLGNGLSKPCLPS